MFKVKTFRGETSFQIHHFHVDHIHFISAPKFCIYIVFDFFWDRGEIGINGYAKLWG